MGVDRPGDMKYLLSIASPNIAVVTEISSSHLEFFGSLDAIADFWAVLPV
jgi:UDP-N-acetylmuramoyl-tripeptide--D-alanyl-D-alanine ligase